MGTGSYVADTLRKTILAAGVASSIDLDLGPNTYTHTVDKPEMAQDGRLNDPDCHPQAWGRALVSGGSLTFQSGRQVVSMVRNSVGNFTVN